MIRGLTSVLTTDTGKGNNLYVNYIFLAIMSNIADGMREQGSHSHPRIKIRGFPVRELNKSIDNFISCFQLHPPVYVLFQYNLLRI